MTPGTENRRNPPRRRVHRRSYRERNFWELMAISALQSKTVSNAFGAVILADTALEKWRERWSEPPEDEDDE